MTTVQMPVVFVPSSSWLGFTMSENFVEFIEFTTAVPAIYMSTNRLINSSINFGILLLRATHIVVGINEDGPSGEIGIWL